MVTWFHGSPHELEVGDVLTPGVVDKNFELSPDDAVCVASTVEDAVYWAHGALWTNERAGRYFVYEVEPLSPVWRFEGRWFSDDRCASARIVAIVLEGEL